MSNIYDNAFRTIINDCRRFVLPFINEVFGEHYDGSEKIVFHPNEHFIARPDGEPDDERITDTNFTVIGSTSKKYHLECESSTYSSKMLIRIFEYDTQIALDEGEVGADRIRVTFPNTAVLYLRENKTTPDKMQMEIETPGGRVEYSIPIAKMQKYSIEDIFEKRLYMLIPFYVFTYEPKFDKNNTDEQILEELHAKLERILARLSILVDDGEISAFDMRTITDLSTKVINSLSQIYKGVNEKVGGIMSRGPMIVTEAKKILNQGIQQGMQQGRNEEKLLIAEKMLMEGDSVEKAAKMTGLSVEVVREMAEKITVMV